MESANIHHQHQLQEHFVGASQPGYGVSTNHDCNPSIILNGSNYNAYVSEILPNSRELWPKDTLIVPQVKTSIIQDFRFCDARSFIHQSANNELHLAKVEEEMSDSFSQFSEVIHSPSSIEEFHLPSTRYIKNQQQNLLDLGENLWLSTFSPGGQISAPQLSARDLYTDAQNSASFGGIATSSRVNFRHDFPSTNISKLDFTSLDSGSLGLNLRALDLLASTNSGGSGSQSSHDSTLGHFKESMSLGHDHMQGSSGRPSSSSNRTSAFMNGVTRTKRPRNFSEPQASHAAVKKSRFLSRSSCPPLKVRKEKLGDRIAVLQRLVAPFGKTDTASVLTEAIGYIQFLQDQIQSSSEEDGEEESKRDLGSRGLCLVPLSCTSYITSYHGGIWPLP